MNNDRIYHIDRPMLLNGLKNALYRKLNIPTKSRRDFDHGEANQRRFLLDEQFLFYYLESVLLFLHYYLRSFACFLSFSYISPCFFEASIVIR